MPRLEQIIATLEAHGQEHVMRLFDQLSAAQQQNLLAQIAQLDLEWLHRAYAEPHKAPDPSAITPYEPVIALDDARSTDAIRSGEAALRAGRVCTLLVAGGQGTRLGFDGPKGALPLGAVSGRTLFQIHTDRLIALGRRYGIVPALYVMTSPANHLETVRVFEQHDCYGLPHDRVIIFPQGVTPAVDEHGKLLLERPDQLVLTPNGNGGLFAAMRDGGPFAHMRAAGIDTISYIQVDNPLALSCDPRFIGFHLMCDSEFSCKAIQKTDAHEHVGCFARVHGKLSIVEYTEIPEDLAAQQSPDGRLAFGFANPGLFVWSRTFAEQQAVRRNLPVHRAHKRIPCLDADGQRIEPATPNGYKLETFALDTLPAANSSIVVACDRNDEFAPVKNASGPDSPISARRLMTALYRRWLEAAGRRVDDGLQIEISPLYALDLAELRQRLPAGGRIETDLFLHESAGLATAH